jgi:RadC-like JAB domain
MLLLNTKHGPVAWHVLSRGCLDATLVHPREVIKAACLDLNVCPHRVLHCSCRARSSSGLKKSAIS